MKYISTDKAPQAIGPYSQGIIAGNTVYLSGQIGIDPAVGKAVEGIEAQTEQICKNIGNLLKEAGTDYAHVVKTTCFLADINDFKTFNGIYEKHFISKPARSCVAVKDLPAGMLCEIEVTAVIE